MNDELFERGRAIRREVLGADYVDKAIAAADDFNMPMQRYVTEACWGAVWGREGLDRRTRSLLNLAMICALNRPHELKLHLVGALNNGVKREEIREVFLQVGAYCGMPAAVDAFRTAREVFAERDKGRVS
jgi:4-carboxymuconolactone decarboxylase